MNENVISKNTPVICSFLGLGLIGGSIAKALKNSEGGQDILIKACDKDASSLSLAKESGCADYCCSTPDEDFLDCDVLFFCAPVTENDRFLEALSEKLDKRTILTDVGSVKSSTCRAVEKAGLSDRFVGGHPMAGSEKTGFANASRTLLENAYYLLTPMPGFPEEKLLAFSDLIRRTGAIPLVMDPQTHDTVTGGISHLPHVISAALVHFVKEHDDSNGFMKQVAAGGFRDITRISSSSPEMWKAICLSNKAVIRQMLSEYTEALTKFDETLERSDSKALYDFFSEAKEYRDSFNTLDLGPIKKRHTLYVDIPDVPGSIAQTATILAEQSLSLKNIGIMHNREFQEGALCIEFYDHDTCENSAALLAEKGYKIFRKS